MLIEVVVNRYTYDAAKDIALCHTIKEDVQDKANVIVNHTREGQRIFIDADLLKHFPKYAFDVLVHDKDGSHLVKRYKEM